MYPNMKQSSKIVVIFALLMAIVLPLEAQEVEQKRDFSWNASAALTSNYIWRGLNCGGPSIQVDATVDYKGLFANVWWNVGATDWTFTALNPEVDITLGYSRWGVTLMYMHMYYFDCYKDGTMSRFFDFKNHEPGGGGTTGEWRVLYGSPIYTSPKGLTTSINALCGVRTFGRDGYYDEATGQLKRAYSTYIEVGCDQELGADWTLAARVGVTPAKSLYTGYKGNFAVTLVGLKLNKSWVLDAGSDRDDKAKGDKKRAGNLNAFAHVMLQPWQVSEDNLIMPIAYADGQKLNIAVGLNWTL